MLVKSLNLTALKLLFDRRRKCVLTPSYPLDIDTSGGSMTKLLIALFGLSITSAAHAKTSTFTISTTHPEVTLRDGKTELSFRKVYELPLYGDEHHQDSGKRNMKAGDWPYDSYSVAQGLPYVSVGGKWLELLHAAKIYQNGYSYVLQNLGCKTNRVTSGDESYPVLDSCEISVQTAKEQAPRMTVGAFKSIPFHVRYKHQSLNTFSDDVFFLALRVTSFSPGNRSANASKTPLSMQAAFDLVTPFGVENVSYDSFKDSPIVNVPKLINTGPITLAVIPQDVGYPYDTGTTGFNNDSDRNYDRLNLLVLVHQNESIFPIAIEYYY